MLLVANMSYGQPDTLHAGQKVVHKGQNITFDQDYRLLTLAELKTADSERVELKSYAQKDLDYNTVIKGKDLQLADLQESLKLQADISAKYKELWNDTGKKPSWAENKYLWFITGVLTVYASAELVTVFERK